MFKKSLNIWIFKNRYYLNFKLKKFVYRNLSISKTSYLTNFSCKYLILATTKNALKLTNQYHKNFFNFISKKESLARVWKKNRLSVEHIDMLLIEFKTISNRNWKKVVSFVQKIRQNIYKRMWDKLKSERKRKEENWPEIQIVLC